MLQVSSRSWSGRIKYCYIHDILRELALSKANENNFILVPSQSQINGSSTLATNARTRRLALIHDEGYKGLPIGSLYPDLRSLICFGDDEPNCSGLRMVRVLYFEFLPEPDLKCLQHWTNLRYFYCWGSNEKWPTSFWNNNMLRVAKCGYHFTMGPPSSAKLDNLVILKGVYARKEWNVKLPHFPLLRKLGFQMAEGDINWEALTNSLSQLEHLYSLRVVALHTLSHPFFTPASANYKKLNSLYIKCSWPGEGLGDCSLFPSNLVKLTLMWCCLEQDPMPELAKLSCLRVLRLLFLSYEGEQLACSARGFRCLHQLKLQDLDKLTKVRLEAGAMPSLNLFEITHCPQLQMLPDLQYLTNLRELKLRGMGADFCSRLKDADQHKVKHITSIIIIEDTR